MEFKHRHHWQILNHYFEKNYTYLNDINLVWRGGGRCQLINKCTTDWKKNPTSIAKKCMYSALEKLVLKYVMLIQLTATNRYSIFSQSQGYNYFYMKKDNKKKDTQFEVKKNCISFQIHTCIVHTIDWIFVLV